MNVNLIKIFYRLFKISNCLQVMPVVAAASLDDSVKIIWKDRPVVHQHSTGFTSIDQISRDWSIGQHAVGLNERYLASFEESKLINIDGFIQIQSGQFIRDTYWVDSQINHVLNYYNPKSFLCRCLRGNVQDLRGNWYSMLLYYSQEYFHWFCDVLPCLYKVKALLPQDTHYIIQNNPPTWMCESIELIGISLEKCYEFDGHLPLKLEKLYFTPPVAMTGDHDPEALKWVRNKILKKAGLLSSIKPKLRLYVSRSKAKCRRIVNEEELLKRLSIFDFQVVLAEMLTLKQQINLFSQAEWIVGPHGAGLTNMLYAPEGTKIIEFFEPSILRRCYYQMSQALNHSHYISVGETIVNGSEEPDIYLNDCALELIERQIKSSCNNV